MRLDALPRCSKESPLSSSGGRCVWLNQSLSLRAFQLSDISLQPEKPTQLPLDGQAAIDAHKNPGNGRLDRLPDFSGHPTAELLGHPLELPFKHGRGELHHGGLLVPIQMG